MDSTTARIRSEPGTCGTRPKVRRLFLIPAVVACAALLVLSASAGIVITGGGLALIQEGGTFAANNLAAGKTAFAQDVINAAPHAIANVNDGVYGNANSWIAAGSSSFIGVSLGATPVPISKVAFGRDNLGVFSDRFVAIYTLQYTTVANPTAATPDGSWTTIGTLDYQAIGGVNFTAPANRHLYSFTAVNATGFRVKIQSAGDLIGVDEIEIYAPLAITGTVTLVEEGGTFAANNLAAGRTAFAKDVIGAAPHTIANLNNGVYGNPNSWIANTTNSFVGINLGATPVSIGQVAFGRDNLGGFSDRFVAAYTLQYTTVPSPNAATADTNWTTIGTLDYQSAGGPRFTNPALRHRFAFAEVAATGVRIKADTTGIPIGMDELEIYPPTLFLTGGGLALQAEVGMFAANNLAAGKTAFAQDVIGVAPHAIAKVNDGVYGNPNSWIAGSTSSFIGISLGATPVTLTAIAFGRDNLGVAADRFVGAYTLQYTTVANPTAATSDTNWNTIGAIQYVAAGGASFASPSRRHLFSFNPVNATGFRIKVAAGAAGSSNFIGIDELELYSAVISQPITWTGAVSNDFLAGGNWIGTNAPPASGDSLIFGTAGPGGLLLNNNLGSALFQVAGITFNSGAGAFVIGNGTTTANAGNAFELTGDVFNNSTNLQTINTPFTMTTVRSFTAGGGNITLGGNLSGTGGGVTKLGTGTLTFTGNDTYTGGTTISAGTLQLGAGGTTGSIAGNVTNNGILVFKRSDDFTYGGVVSGSGTVVNDGNILRLTAAQTYTGPTLINSGALVLQVDAGLSASTVVTVGSTGRLDLGNHAQTIGGLAGVGRVYSFPGSAGSLTLNVPNGQSYTYSGSLGDTDPNFAVTVSGLGTQIIASAATYTGPTTIDSGGTLQLGSGGATGALPPGSTITTAGTLAFNRSNTVIQGVDFGSVINGTGRVLQQGSGKVILTGANAHGDTQITRGTLQIGNGGTSGSIASSVGNNGILAFKRSDDFTYGAVIYGGGTVVNDGNILRFSAAQTYTGPTLINSGVLVLPTGLDFALSPATTVTVASGGKLDLSNRRQKFAGLAGAGTVYSFGGSAGSLTLEVAPGQTNTFSGTLGSADPNLAFIKAGLGTQVLSGTNNYAGPTTVAGGTLRLNFGTVSSNILPSTAALALGGGTLALNGAGSQRLGGLTTISNTGSRIQLGTNQTLTLGALTSAGSGSSLSFDLTAGGANASIGSVGSGVVILTGQTPGLPIHPAFTVRDAGGFGLATVDALNRVIRLTNTTTTPLLPPSGAVSTNAYAVNNNAGGSAAPGSSTLILSAPASPGSVQVDTTAASGVLTLGAGVLLRNNTWGFSGSGAHTYTITGDQAGAGLTSLGTGGSIVFHNYNSGAVTIASPILASGVNTVAVEGTGTTVFAGANTYTGGTAVNGGTLQLGDGFLASTLSVRGGSNNVASSGADGEAGGIAVVVNKTGSLTSKTGLAIVGGGGGAGGSGTGASRGGAGGAGGTGIALDTSGTADVWNVKGGEGGIGGLGGDYLSGIGQGQSGGAGGAGGSGIAVNTANAVQIGNVTGGAGGAGAQGGSGLSPYPFSAPAGPGGPGGAGGLGIAPSNLNVFTGGTIVGGAGGSGGSGGIGYSYAITGTGGVGGTGGTGILLTASGILNVPVVRGGSGGQGGYAGVNFLRDAFGPMGAGGAGGVGGAGIGIENGSTLEVSSNALVTGGSGGAGQNGTVSENIQNPGNGGNGGAGGRGGSGVHIVSGGFLNNRGTITGGNGGLGGAGAFNQSWAGNGGAGGTGGAGASFASGGSLNNSGTITGGSLASGGAGGPSGTSGRGGIPGNPGGNGVSVLFTGGPAILSNLNGGVINGTVAMENFANQVTLEPGSRLNGALSIGSNSASTLTLSGTGSQNYSGAVTGATTFAGSLIKSGSGTWVLDQPWNHTGPTLVNAGTLKLAGTLGNTAVTVSSGAALSGEGSIGAAGSLALNHGSSLIVDASTDGALSVGGNLTFSGTVDVGLSSVSAARTIRVLNYSGSLTGSAANLTASGLRNPVFSTATPGQVNLTFGSGALTWSGGTAAWDINTTANWNAGADKFLQGDAVTFGNAGTKTLLVDAAIAAGSIVFNHSAGIDYTLGGGGSLTGGITQTGDGNVTINLPVGGSGSVIKSGTGTLMLTRDNSYAGPTTINAGTLRLGDGGTAGSLAPGAITNHGTLILNQADTVTQGTDFGIVSGTGQVIHQGSGTLILTGPNTYTGGTTLSGGPLQVGTGGTTGSLLGNVTNHSTLVFKRSDDYTFTGAISGSGGFVHQGNILRLSGAQTYTGPTRINTGVLVFPATGADVLSPSTIITVVSNAMLELSGRNQTISGLEGGGTVRSVNSSGSTLTLGLAASQTNHFAGTLGGSDANFALTKSGSGTQILSGTNNYTGGTTISGGTLRLGIGGSSGSIIGDIMNNGTLVIHRGDEYPFNGVISGSGGVISAGQTVRFNQQQNYTGPTRIDAGILALSPTVANGLSPATFVTVASGATLDLSGLNQTFSRFEGGGTVYSSASSGGMLTLDIAANQTNHFAGTLGGSRPNFALTKTGGGTLILSGTQNYTDVTTVNAGRLSLQSAESTLAAVTVGNGAALSADATIWANRCTVSGNLTLTGGTLTGNTYIGDATTGQFLLTDGGQRVLVSGDNQSTISAEMHLAGTHTFDVGDGASAVDLLVTSPLGHWHGVAWGGARKTGNGTMFLAASMDGTNSAGASGIYGLGGFELAGGALIFSGSLGYSAWEPAGKGGYFLADFSGNSTLKWGAGNTKDISVNGNLRIRDGVTATLDSNGNDITLGSAVILGPGGTAGLTKAGAGALTLNAVHAYTGPSTVTGGTLVVNGSISASSGVSVSNGGVLGGAGRVSAINGAGLVAPGRAKVLTAAQADPGAGLDFAFNFTQPGAPVYTNASASSNSVLHLTAATPIASPLTASNTVTLDFSGATLVGGQTYLGGFFLDAAVPDSVLTNATFAYVGTQGAAIRYHGLVPQTNAAFATGTVASGKVMAFQVIALPEIAVSGNGVDIAQGDATPALADHTDFGSVAVSGGTIVRTFTITNSGAGNLTLNSVTVGGAHAGDFTVSVQPASPVTSRSSTTFQVTFDPGAAGLRSATLSVTNNDADENPFAFSIQGTGVPPVFPVITPQSVTRLGNGSFQFSFTNTAATIFSVLTTTNISLPASDWTVLGPATNAGGGIYQFTDPDAAIHSRRFYMLRQP